MYNLEKVIDDKQQSFKYDPEIHPNHHALICVSPFNGYFTLNNMDKLFRWTNDHFENFNIFVMDEASKYTLIATGYSEDKAIKKTNKQDRNLHKKVNTCLMNLGFSADDSQKKIFLLSQLVKKNSFIKLYNRYLRIFQDNLAFQQDCLNASKSILEGKMDTVTIESLRIATQYLLLELPVWFNIPDVLDIPFTVLIYKDFSLPWRNLCCNYGLLSRNQKIYVKNVESDTF